MSVIERFERVYLGDECIRRITLDIPTDTCRFLLSGASLHRLPVKPFDYEITYHPAILEFTGVRKINYPDWYCLNFEIVDYEVTPDEQDGYYRFSLTMLGGWDNDTFMRKIEIVAKDFSLSGTTAEFPTSDD